MDPWIPHAGLPEAGRPVPVAFRAESVADGRPLVGVSVCYDASRGIITPAMPVAGGLGGAWSAPALVGPLGGLTALAAIPAALVHSVGRPRLRVHTGHRLPGRPAG